MWKISLLIPPFLFSAIAFCQSVNFHLVGKVDSRHAREIASSNWSIGGETMDRDYTDYKHWGKYLGPTGAKKVRLQAGWAKCEPQKGIYNFQWLDEIIDDVLVQGVEPWLQTSYGNPIYEGGGQIFLSGGFPTSEIALDAWDRWVSAMVERYQGKVKVWEIWNESDLNEENPADAYAKLFIRTAEIIRNGIPNATIYGLSLAGINNTSYVDEFLRNLKNRDKLHLLDQITLHGYTARPEANHQNYLKIARLVKSYDPRLKIHQGELGCPSENQPYYALRNYDWTEISQSKWLLRRLLGDLGHDIPSLYFSIIDMNYVRKYRREGKKVILLDEPIHTVNRKGLLRANKDNTVERKKQAYGAFQNTTSIFDHTLHRISNYPYTTSTDSSLSLYAYALDGFDHQIVTIWLDGKIPNNQTEKTAVDFEFSAGNFTTPVYVDMRTGEVYEIPNSNWDKNGTKYSFHTIPLYDSPILIAERNMIPITSYSQ